MPEESLHRKDDLPQVGGRQREKEDGRLQRVGRRRGSMDEVIAHALPGGFEIQETSCFPDSFELALACRRNTSGLALEFQFDSTRATEAERAARKAAQRDGVELVVHRRDGRIRDKDSHGPDPYPPEG